jgi:hypothetical protein
MVCRGRHRSGHAGLFQEKKVAVGEPCDGSFRMYKIEAQRGLIASYIRKNGLLPPGFGDGF